MKKLAIITTHPIQYNAPLFQLLAERNIINLKVFYTWSQSETGVLYDPGFELDRKWDIPLLNGYDFEFIRNTSMDPGSHHYKGIINPNLISLIENYNPSIILIYGWNFESHLKVMRHFKGKIPIWFRGDSTLLDESPGFHLKKIIRRIALRWVFSFVDKALFVGTANKAYFLKHGLVENQLALLPHVVDNMRFAEPNEFYQAEAKSWRSKLGILNNDLVFLFAGKLEEKKNPEILINAFSKINLNTVHLVVAGNGQLEFTLRAKYKEVKNLHFIGFQNQSQMPILYRIADIFVLPSSGPGETWGLAVNEAMACRCAIIASDKCGVSLDLIESGINGFVFQSKEEDDLLHKLQLVIENTSLLMLMQENSFSKISKFNLESNAFILEKLLLSN